MKQFCKYFEKRKLLLEISNSKDSFNIVLWRGDNSVFWWRKSHTCNYFEFTISDFVVLCTHRNSFKILGMRIKF